MCSCIPYRHASASTEAYGTLVGTTVDAREHGGNKTWNKEKFKHTANPLWRAYTQACSNAAAAASSPKRAALRPAVVMRALPRRLAPHRLRTAKTAAIISSSRGDQGDESDQGDDTAGASVPPTRPEADGAKYHAPANSTSFSLTDAIGGAGSAVGGLGSAFGLGAVPVVAEAGSTAAAVTAVPTNAATNAATNAVDTVAARDEYEYDYDYESYDAPYEDERR